MATVNYSITSTKTSKACVATWAAIANGNDGAALDQSQYTDKSVQVSGTFGSSGSVRLQGSNDGVNWNTLSDPQGVALDITTACVKFVAEATRYIKPLVTAGDGTTALTVTILLKE